EIHKDRLRWLINYKGIEFFINLDKLTRPAHEGYYLEVKSRTWSKRDAELKAKLIEELLALFGLANDATLKEEYVEMLAN
ncbi:MAG TPA: amidohydrolase, partial [Anaerolineae bacterium]